MHPYKNRHTDRKLHLNKSIPTRTDTRVGNYTLTKARIWSYIMCFRATAVPRGLCCEPSLWTDGLSPSSWGHLSTSYLITEQWKPALGEKATFSEKPLLSLGVMQHHCCPGVLHDTNGVPGCYAIPLLSWSITQHQWCTRVLCNNTVVLEYYMIPMVYQGVMQHHCCPGVLHDTNGVPGCYAITLLSWSITQHQWCARVLCNTTVVLEYYTIPMVCHGVMQYHYCPGVLHTNGVPGCYAIPLLLLSVMQYHC